MNTSIFKLLRNLVHDIDELDRNLRNLFEYYYANRQWEAPVINWESTIDACNKIDKDLLTLTNECLSDTSLLLDSVHNRQAAQNLQNYVRPRIFLKAQGIHEAARAGHDVFLQQMKGSRKGKSRP